MGVDTTLKKFSDVNKDILMHPPAFYRTYVQYYSDASAYINDATCNYRTHCFETIALLSKRST